MKTILTVIHLVAPGAVMKAADMEAYGLKTVPCGPTTLSPGLGSAVRVFRESKG